MRGKQGRIQPPSSWAKQQGEDDPNLPLFSPKTFVQRSHVHGEPENIYHLFAK